MKVFKEIADIIESRFEGFTVERYNPYIAPYFIDANIYSMVWYDLDTKTVMIDCTNFDEYFVVGSKIEKLNVNSIPQNTNFM